LDVVGDGRGGGCGRLFASDSGKMGRGASREERMRIIRRCIGCDRARVG
jgi:hypothetical protein